MLRGHIGTCWRLDFKHIENVLCKAPEVVEGCHEEQGSDRIVLRDLLAT